MSILFRLSVLKTLPVALSLLLHAAACGAIMLAPALSVVRGSVIIAELVVDPEPPPPTVKPEPRKPDASRLKLPRPIQTPMPTPVEPPVDTPRVEPPRPAPVAPAPTAPVAPLIAAAVPETAPTTEPIAPAGRGPLAPVDAPLATADGQGLPTQSGPPTPARPATPSVAALPSEGITQTAAPRGGYQVKPSYPPSARRAGIQGTTLLGVFIAADGHVGDVVVKQSAGHPDLDAAAADAVRRWRFEPARRGSEPIAMWVLLPVEFRLR
jgi:periplasmic protein TonB